MIPIKIKQRLVALALAALAVATFIAAIQREDESYFSLAITASTVMLAASLVLFISSFTAKRDFLQLNWFLPFLKKNRNAGKPTWLLGTFQSILPKSWFADRVKGKPGAIRKFLKRIGPSLLSSPLRRMIQALCLAVFVLLFFYVCWPYHAKPAIPGESSQGWRFVGIDQDSGNLNFDGQEQSDWRPDIDQTTYLAKSTTELDPASDRSSIACELANIDDSICQLKPSNDLTDGELDQLLTFTGKWSLNENDPNAWPSHYTDSLDRKELIPADMFLAIDPLVSLSTAIASRSWVWSLTSAGIILLICVMVPRGFCGYICPLGTVIDLFDWAVAGRVKKFRVPNGGWWVHVKYFLLAGILICSTFGVLVSGIFAAIPIVTRAFLFIGEPLQTATMRDLHQVAPMNMGHAVSIGLFLSILALGFLRPRFWCKYVCPSGAVFSIGNLFRVTERKVESSCINCNKCVEICPFDAIKPDFTTRTSDCTLCQTCGGVCPTHAIKFVDRWSFVELKTENDPPTNETSIGRRGFLSLAAGSAAAVAGGIGVAATTKAFGAHLDDQEAFKPVRPPGSVPEEDFLQMCIRCGECFKACPNNVLQAEGFQQGLEGLWAPMVNADWAGCESSCNACGQVCPTGAIRALPLEEKKVARMGLAIVNQQTCLPLAGREACQLCVDECNAAGYRAIEFAQVHTQTDEQGQPIPDSGFLAPVVLADKCVGCGLCQTRCHSINVKANSLLEESAIIIEAGPGKEDRLRSGSYLELREAERASMESNIPGNQPVQEFFVPENSIPKVSPDEQPSDENSDEDNEAPKGQRKEPNLDDDPFGL